MKDLANVSNVKHSVPNFEVKTVENYDYSYVLHDSNPPVLIQSNLLVFRNESLRKGICIFLLTMNIVMSGGLIAIGMAYILVSIYILYLRSPFCKPYYLTCLLGGTLLLVGGIPIAFGMWNELFLMQGEDRALKEHRVFLFADCSSKVLHSLHSWK